jgi:hypothetical protein
LATIFELNPEGAFAVSDPSIQWLYNSLRPRWSAYDNALQQQRRARARAQRLAELTGRPCEFCGQPFDPARETARYCSTTCRAAAWRAAQER